MSASLINDLPRAVQLRNFLAHDYGAVDDEIIWDVATVHCPAMHDVIARLIDNG